MSKKHHSKRSCLEDTISEEKKSDEKEYKKKISRHKKHHKKHSKKLYEEYTDGNVIENTISDDIDKVFSEKTTKKQYSKCDDDYLEDRYDKKSKKVCFEEDFEEHIEFEHVEDSHEKDLNDIEDEHTKDCNDIKDNLIEDEHAKDCNDIEDNHIEDEHAKDCNDIKDNLIEDCHAKDCNDIKDNLIEDCHAKDLNDIEDNHIKNHNDIEDCVKSCNAKSETKTLSLCPNTPQTVTGTTRPVVIKTPVVLAEPKVEISTESVLKLEDPVLEIKRIRKNVYVEQCRVIQDSSDPNFGTLFLEGFIRKNIEYATRDCCVKGITSGKIKHTTVKIPFTCATRVQFTTLPIFTVTPPPVQVEILQDNIKICNPCEEGISGHNPCQLNLRLYEFFNEKIYCELVSAEIVESDFLEEPTKENFECILDKTYRNVREKVVVNLTIKLLQNQQVSVNRANTE